MSTGPSAIKSFTLPISPTYVADWGLWEGVRELIQNGIDREQEDMSARLSIRYDAKERILVIGSDNTQLSTNTLILGNSTKGADQIGKFGEGYKLAILALIRLGNPVLVLQKGQTWIPALVYNPDYDSDCLQIDVEPTTREQTTLEFRVYGLTGAEWKEIRGKYIHDALDNTRLRNRPGQIFVRGLFVTKLKDYKYGYNFGTGIIPLNRDRNMSNEFDIKWATSGINAKYRENKNLLRMILDQKSDVNYIGHHISPGKVAKLIATWREQYNDAVPVSDESQIKKLAPGVRYKIVPQWVSDMLHSLGSFAKAFSDRRASERLERIKQWAIQKEIPEELLAELDEVIEEIKTGENNDEP